MLILDMVCLTVAIADSQKSRDQNDEETSAAATTDHSHTPMKIESTIR
jgi:hypothetical protein